MASAIFLDPVNSGDIFPFPLTFTDPTTGLPFDLTGVTIGCTIKNDPTDSDLEAVYSSDIAGDATGKITFTLGPFEVGTLYLDVKWFAPGTRQTVISTTEFVVHQSVTARSSPGSLAYA